MKYLVTGATGNIGSLVTQRLLDVGDQLLCKKNGPIPMTLRLA